MLTEVCIIPPISNRSLKIIKSETILVNEQDENQENQAKTELITNPSLKFVKKSGTKGKYTIAKV